MRAATRVVYVLLCAASIVIGTLFMGEDSWTSGKLLWLFLVVVGWHGLLRALWSYKVDHDRRSRRA